MSPPPVSHQPAANADRSGRMLHAPARRYESVSYHVLRETDAQAHADCPAQADARERSQGRRVPQG